jgi:SPX domain protein involved in polyphosphate accumulation
MKIIIVIFVELIEKHYKEMDKFSIKALEQLQINSLKFMKTDMIDLIIYTIFTCLNPKTKAITQDYSIRL